MSPDEQQAIEEQEKLEKQSTEKKSKAKKVGFRDSKFVRIALCYVYHPRSQVARPSL